MKGKQFWFSDAVLSISFWWLVMALPRESHPSEIRAKSKRSNTNIVELHAPTHRLHSFFQGGVDEYVMYTHLTSPQSQTLILPIESKSSFNLSNRLI